jgi:serine/threonine-protein kinase
VVRIITAVADALDYAHQKGLLHRDIKPANILLSDSESAEQRIMLADFGIARRIGQANNLTGTNMTVGTVAYAAPEQLKGEDMDGRADQYALASTAFHLLTGSPPFQHSNPAVVISQHLTADPPPIAGRRPDLSGLGPAFDKALAKSPKDRYDRCSDFAKALAHRLAGIADEGGVAECTVAALAAAPAPAVVSSGPRHAKPDSPSGRGRLVALGALAATVLIVVGLVALVWGRNHPKEGAAAAAPGVPVVVIGADCAPLGSAGVTTSGAQAYCARLPAVNDEVWSLYVGDVPSPTSTPGPGEPVYDPETEAQVRVCTDQTQQSRAHCHESIASSNEQYKPPQRS